MDNFDEVLCKIILDNRRVIIPDIGAFINNASEGNIVFSPLLKSNDGFLEDEIQKDIADPADFVKKYAENIIAEIKKRQRYNIAGLGYFFTDENGCIRFAFDEPEDAAVHGRPAAYRSEKKGKNGRFGLVVALICLCSLAVGCLFFFLFGKFNADDRFDSSDFRTEKPDNQFVIADESDRDDETEILQPSNQINLKYHVIAGCFEEKSNANNFVRQCIKMGYDKSEILPCIGHLHPVSIGNFASHDEALNRKQEYDRRFGENSWIYKMK
ncbi:MAG: SPOR domain-containing protein [Prevotellaceae bacterium]|jgi:hypothetical protein|nr:SPOR domain-containing protein [Prevotellaceae bacterium]